MCCGTTAASGRIGCGRNLVRCGGFDVAGNADEGGHMGHPRRARERRGEKHGDGQDNVPFSKRQRNHESVALDGCLKLDSLPRIESAPTPPSARTSTGSPCHEPTEPLFGWALRPTQRVVRCSITMGCRKKKKTSTARLRCPEPAQLPIAVYGAGHGKAPQDTFRNTLSSPISEGRWNAAPRQQHRPPSRNDPPKHGDDGELQPAPMSRTNVEPISAKANAGEPQPPPPLLSNTPSSTTTTMPLS